MNRQVRLLARAQLDLLRLEDFLGTRSLSAATRAAKAIAKAVVSLDELAERHPVIDEEGTRELAVDFGRDGYVVQYRVVGELVLIARIFHAREYR